MRGTWSGIAVVISVLLLTVAAPATAGGQTIAEGHIEAGAPAAHAFLVFVIGLPPDLADTPWAFNFDPSSAAGSWIEPSVIDNSGASYVVRFYFYDDAQHRIETPCEPMEGNTALLTEPYGELLYRERCLVPEDARLAVLAADAGALLDVRIIQTNGT